MDLLQSIKNLFFKGSERMNNSGVLQNLTDDPRIKMTPEEQARIKTAERYYAGLYTAQKGMPYNTVSYYNQQSRLRTRHFNALNMAKTCANRLASILLNSSFDLSVELLDGSNSEDLNKFVQSWITKSGLKQNLENKVERAIAVGGMAVRPYVDEYDNIKLSWIRADQFFNLEANTEEISESAIASVKTQKLAGQTFYYTLLEFHQWHGTDYVITFELYKSDRKEIVGKQVPLGTDGMYDNLTSPVVYHNLQRPLFVYFKNPSENNLDAESPLGVGIVNNAQSILDAINYTYDAFIWETRMARRKVFIPGSMMRPADSTHMGPAFNPDQDVYIATSESMNGDNQQITSVNPDMRVQEYEQAMQMHYNTLENNVGLSYGTFSVNADGGVATATQINSENSMSHQTRESYLTAIDKFLTELVKSMLEIAQEPSFFTGDAKIPAVDIDNVKVNIHYDDSLFVDKDDQFKTDMMAVQDGIISKKTFLMRNYGYTEEQAENELQEIRNETPEPARGLPNFDEITDVGE